MTISPLAGAGDGAPAMVARHDQLREAAQKLETQFLSEMLKAAGHDARPGSFSGGIGEEQFASFLRHEHAKAVSQAGGIGLAEVLFQTLLARQDD